MRPLMIDMTREEYEQFKLNMIPMMTIDNFMALLDAVSLYADPDTYRDMGGFCVGLNAGALKDDFSHIKHFHEDLFVYEEEVPGATARQALYQVFEEDLQ